MSGSPGAHYDALPVDREFEARIRSFAPPSQLPHLRERVDSLHAQLGAAVRAQDYDAAAALRDEAEEVACGHPELYARTLRQRLDEHVREERYDDAARIRDQMIILRRFQPQYQVIREMIREMLRESEWNAESK